jgi:hypothetical protein
LISESIAYEFVSVLFESERTGVTAEFRNLVTDLDVYEHMDKPYLTAQMLMLDNEDILDEADILGGERITISIQSQREDTEPFTMKFYILKVLNTEKVNDNVQTIALSLIEDIGYISNLQNVNQYFNGNVTQIVKDIATSYLEKEVVGDDAKQNVHLIVPNLSPLEAIKWITNRATDERGYPFYTYSTMVKDKLYMKCLGDLLAEPVMNTDVPYRNSTLAAQATNADVRRRTILSHKFNGEMENLFDVIRRGVIGARYNYLNTLYSSGSEDFHFDIVQDLFRQLIDDGVLQQNQPNYEFSEKYEYDGQSFNEFDSRTITQIRSSGAYRTSEGDDYNLSYGECREPSDYKLEIIARAMNIMMKRHSMTMVVDGLDFIDGDMHKTIGNSLRVEFGTSNPDRDPADRTIDAKKSGDYLIYSSRHMFKKEKYEVVLTCMKIGNYRR